MSRRRTTKPKRSKKRKVPPSTKMGRSKRRPKKPAPIDSDGRLETALKYLREGRSQKRAAEIGMVSAKRFRHFLRSHKLARFKNGRWQITDRRTREIAIISEGEELVVKVRGFSLASLAMRHRAAVNHFLDSNDASLLTPFDGTKIKDIKRRTHLLETRPNVLLRLANAGGDAEMKIYRLID
jgi:hypothetical protein